MFEDIMYENFPNSMQNINLHFQEITSTINFDILIKTHHNQTDGRQSQKEDLEISKREATKLILGIIINNINTNFS